MAISPALFSSNTDEWTTPDDFYRTQDAEFHFDVDAACTSRNCKAFNGFAIDLGVDALVQHWPDWGKTFWLNPPFSRKLMTPFIRKAYESSQLGLTVVCLVPSRTDTQWWHDYVLKAAEVRFVKGRLKFGGSKHNAPFPVAIVVFRGTK